MQLESEGIDLADPVHEGMLTDLQGNILKSHGRRFSILLFLRFNGDGPATRAWIRTFSRCLESARDQWISARHGERYRDRLFRSFLLSADGYHDLCIATLPSDLAFRNGMKAGSGRLGDPDPREWQAEYDGPIHALIILAHRREHVVCEEAARITVEVAQVARVVAREVGRRLCDDSGRDIEHFGFVGGVSQPLFTRQDILAAMGQGVRVFDPTAPLGLALVRDPNGARPESLGSYLVYRKLAQNVSRWNATVEALARHLGMQPELLRAFAVGRFRDGTPVALHDAPVDRKQPGNDFDFDRDKKGRRCPFHAHIRKVNPRGESGMPNERSSRIVRRSIPYGLPGELDVGLLFMCYQADIARQFETQQVKWSSNPHFLHPETGLDPVIGQAPQADDVKPHWPISWGSEQSLSAHLGRSVELQGGEYFFAPSISFLRTL